MSDYPERINISPVHRQKREDDFYLVDRAAFPGKGVEYTRTDHVQTLIAAEREACAELCDVVSMDSIGDIIRGIGDEIRARSPADAQASLDARDKRVRDEALREVLGRIVNLKRGHSEDVDEGHEQVYRAIEALIEAKPTTPPSHG